MVNFEHRGIAATKTSNLPTEAINFVPVAVPFAGALPATSLPAQSIAKNQPSVTTVDP